MNVPERVRQTLRELPDEPGCYLMRDRSGTIIYVGKAASLRKRVSSYFRDSTLRSATPKVRSLINSVWELQFIVVRNEAEAILTEGRLIKENKPRYNISLRDDKRFLLLAADPDQPFPRLRLCRIQREDKTRYFGPYASAASARAALDFTEKTFGLRKCVPTLPDPETYRHCLNDIIRFCSAPCVGRVTPEQYREQFEEACAFLRGARPQYLKALRERMQEASDALQFEEAGALRDTLFLLTAAVKQKARMMPTPELRKQDAALGLSVLRTVLGLASEPRVIVGFDVSTISGTHSVGSLVCFEDGAPSRGRYRRFRIRTVPGTDDPAMMAEIVRRYFERILREQQPIPGLVVVDGGVTQLRAARRELAGLGLERIPVVGLAKRLEEIHKDDGQPPVRLDADSPALKILQHLRDEAHRFAITYHRRIRQAKIRDSVLDEVPGIGPRKKEMLLKQFGSVARIARASTAELAAAPGVGLELARAIQMIIHARNRADSAGPAGDAMDAVTSDPAESAGGVRQEGGNIE